MTQKGLINKVLKTCGMEQCNTKATPAAWMPLGTNADGRSFKEKWKYASLVGMLIYLASNTRPDIQFAVHHCARFNHNPKESHGEAIKKICRYLAGTKDKGTTFSPTKTLSLDCYVDADFAGLWSFEGDQDPVCVESRTGYVFMLGGYPLILKSKLQTEISLSVLEAEYIALSQSMRELLPLRNLL